MTSYDNLRAHLNAQPKNWLVTGAAGFIGSNLVECLLQLGQKVRGLDDFSTGHAENLAQVEELVSPEEWARFEFVKGDIRDRDICGKCCEAVDFVLHQAALGSVPRSIEDPITANESNVNGTLNMLLAARDQKVRRFVYASSSAIYGDDPGLPKVEEHIGGPLSPYAVTKLVDELYAEVFGRCYGLQTVGLRYFNVFGPRQDPEGAYAAVIPKWIAALLLDAPIQINGDGETSRDFCYISNVVQANLLAATAPLSGQVFHVFNISVGEQTTLNELYRLLRDKLATRSDLPHELAGKQPEYRDFRPGDVRHSLADISKVRRILGYSPTHHLADGLDAALDWYVQNTRATAVHA